MLRSPIFALGTLGVGNRPAAVAPHHWHFSHPAFVVARLRITEVPFVKYRTIELFCFQGADFIENLRNLGLPKNYPSNW